MDKMKQWVALTVVGVLAVVAGGWFLLVSPKRTEAAGVKAQAAQKTNENAVLVGKIKILKAQARDLPRQQARLAAVAAKIPDNPALPALIRALTAAAEGAGVELVSLSPGTPTTVVAPVATAAVVAAPGTTTKTGSLTARPTAAGATASAGTLQAIGLSVNVVGGYFQVEQFLDRVEGLSRAMKVTGFSLAPGQNPVKPAPVTSTTTAPATDPGKLLNATISGNVYVASGRATAPATVVGK